LEDCRTLGLECLANVINPPVASGSLNELEAALDAIERARPDALFVWVGLRFLGAAGFDRLVAFAIEHRLPQMWDVDAARRGAPDATAASHRLALGERDRISEEPKPPVLRPHG